MKQTHRSPQFYLIHANGQRSCIRRAGDFYDNLKYGNLIQTAAQHAAARSREFVANVCPGLIAYFDENTVSGVPELRFEIAHRMSFEDIRDQLVVQFEVDRVQANEVAWKIVRARKDKFVRVKSFWPGFVRRVLLLNATRFWISPEEIARRAAAGLPVLECEPPVPNAPLSGFKLYV